MVLYISGIKVAYGSAPSQVPTDIVHEIHNRGDDINQDFGGDFVWLIAEFNSNPDYACNSFTVVIQRHSDEKRQDLARGAGGEFRYLIPFSSASDNRKITEIGLLRADSDVYSPPAGYQGMTGDINRGREKSFLYLVWKEVIV